MHLRWIFIFGLFWFVLGVISITNNLENYFNYGYLLAAILYFGMYYFKIRNQYLTFENGIITLNSLISKKMNLTDLIQIKKRGKDYILRTENNELHIKTRLIDKNSLKDLKAILKNY